MSTHEPSPDDAMPADLPKHARERLAEMRQKHFFTSDLSVSEFVLLRQAGFVPLGMVMGCSIYNIRPFLPSFGVPATGVEIDTLTHALYDSREFAMARMVEEAEALGADGIVGVRLDVKLHAWGSNVAEFMAVGTAVRFGAQPGAFRAPNGKPFASDLSGQDFWTLLRAGWRPIGLVIGNSVHFVPKSTVYQQTGTSVSAPIAEFTHAMYDARETAMARLQAEAEELGAQGIVGVTFEEKHHGWGGKQGRFIQRSEVIEFFVLGTAVLPLPAAEAPPQPTLVQAVNE